MTTEGPDNPPDPLATLTVLATRLRDTAAGIADRANIAAGGPERDHSAEDPVADAWSNADFGTLIALAGQLGDAVPAELKARLGSSIDEILTVTRELIDWYLTRETADHGDDPSGGAPPSA